MIQDLFKSKRETIFFLVEELGRTGLDERSRTLISDLRRHVKVVLVGKCYLSFWHPARRLWMRRELYGLPSDRFEEKLQAFAARIIERHRPTWAINHGWDNGELVGALERRDLPVVSFIDRPAPATSQEEQANHTFRYAAEVLFSENEIVRSLTISRWALDARRFDVLTVAESTIETIVSVGRRAASKRVEALKQQSLDLRMIDAAGGVDSDLAIDAGGDTREATETYLRASRLNSPREGIFAGRALRRPIAGFNPLIYASDRVGFDATGAEDPLAHYIRTDRPTGRWTHEVIRPDFEAGKVKGLAVAIHAHLHYPDLLPDLYRRLKANRTHIDLIVTTTSEQHGREIERLLGGATIKSIVVCANHGRNLWPFL